MVFFFPETQTYIHNQEQQVQRIHRSKSKTKKNKKDQAKINSRVEVGQYRSARAGLHNVKGISNKVAPLSNILSF